MTSLARRIAIAAAFALAFVAMTPGGSAVELRTPDFPETVTCHETEEGNLTCEVCARQDTEGDWPVGEDHDDGVVVWVAFGSDPATFKAGYTETC